MYIVYTFFFFLLHLERTHPFFFFRAFLFTIYTKVFAFFQGKNTCFFSFVIYRKKNLVFQKSHACK